MSEENPGERDLEELEERRDRLSEEIADAKSELVEGDGPSSSDEDD